MNKVKRYKAVMSAAILVMSVSAGHSRSAIEEQRAGTSQFETGMDVKELMNKQSQETALPRPEPRKASEAAGGMYGPGKSAFAGLEECNIVNVKFARQPSLKDAVKMLQPCMQAVTKKYGVTVSASEYLIESLVAIPPVKMPGIGILVSGKVPLGNTVLSDLYYTVDVLHYGGLLCHPAKVEYLGEIVALDGAVKSGPENLSPGAAREAIKKEIESRFLGIRTYSVVTGIQVEQTGLAPGLYEFKAHEKIVGHGWEERYAVTGICDLNTGKVDYQSAKIWGNRNMWPQL